MTQPSPVPTGPVMRVRATLAYDGTGFHGFAENIGVRTVAGEFITSITQWLRAPERVELACAGRTDRGVHARGQVVSFDVPVATDLTEMALRLNRRLGPEIAVRDVRVTSQEFDARFSATSRRYRYLVWNAVEPDPFLFGRAWHVDQPLSLDLLRLSCDPFIGLHDFSSFCRRSIGRDGTENTLMRRVRDARWARIDDQLLSFEIEASSFCHRMVRSIVGSMVEAGTGRTRVGDLLGVIRARDRAAAGDVAPAHGLYLMHVTYDEQRWLPDAE